VKLAIGIATYKRPYKLLRLLQSLEKQTFKNFDIMIVFDNNDFGSQQILTQIPIPIFRLVVNSSQKFVIGCWNLFHKDMIGNYNAHLTLCDDVALYDDCLQRVVDCLYTNFSDTDGVVGITQVYPRPNIKFQPTGQVLMGRKFVERFSSVDYQVCCPAYSQWQQDSELLKYTSQLGKFVLCEQARLTHYHPVYYRKELDDTHRIVRGAVYRKDKEIYNGRNNRGLVWGNSWEL